MLDILPKEDIELLTGKQMPHAQRKALDELHIPFKVRRDGTPVVAKLAAEQCLGVKSEASNDAIVKVKVGNL